MLPFVRNRSSNRNTTRRYLIKFENLGSNFFLLSIADLQAGGGLELGVADSAGEEPDADLGVLG
jgi:hypothetical protein